MKGLLNHGGAFVTLRLRHTMYTQFFTWRRGPQQGGDLTGLASTSCHGQRLIATFLPGSKALCAHAYIQWVIMTEGRLLIILHVIMTQHELQTRSSDSMGRSCRTEAHSGPFLELHCLWHVFHTWCKIIRELTNDKSSNERQKRLHSHLFFRCGLLFTIGKAHQG